MVKDGLGPLFWKELNNLSFQDLLDMGFTHDHLDYDNMGPEYWLNNGFSSQEIIESGFSSSF